MKIGRISNQNFRRIKIDSDSLSILNNTSNEEDIISLKKMNLRGFKYGYISSDDSGLTLTGCQPYEQRKNFSIHIAGRPTAQKVIGVVNIYNKSTYL